MRAAAANAPAEKKSSRLPGIDALRALAALAVVITHLPFSLQSGVEHAAHLESALPGWLVAFTHYGQYGVHLFLVISGFCIHMQWARRADTPAPVAFLAFWKRRLRRLYPPYFAALAASLIGLAILARLSGGTARGVGAAFGYSSSAQFVTDVVLLLLLAQNLNGASLRVGNAPFWSLALEEQLYMLYFPLLALRRLWGWRVALPAVLSVSLAWRAAFMTANDVPGFWYVVGPARWFEWTLGAVAVEAHLGRLRLPVWLSSPVTLGATLALAVAVTPPAAAYVIPGAHLVDDLLFSAAGFVLVNWFCRLDREGKFDKRVIATRLAKLGVMSYSLYLVHNPVMIVVKRLAILVGIHNVILLSALRFGAALASGYAFFWLVERHFLNASRAAGGEATKPTVAPEGAT